MIRQEFGIYDENFNDGLLNEEGGIRFGNNTVLDDTLRLDDDFRGGGGGGITRGGGISTVINGCTDPNAKNYNRFATRDDGSCFYNPPPLPVVNDKSKSITFTITSEEQSLCLCSRSLRLQFVHAHLPKPRLHAARAPRPRR